MCPKEEPSALPFFSPVSVFEPRQRRAQDNLRINPSFPINGENTLWRDEADVFPNLLMVDERIKLFVKAEFLEPAWIILPFFDGFKLPVRERAGDVDPISVLSLASSRLMLARLPSIVAQTVAGIKNPRL